MFLNVQHIHLCRKLLFVGAQAHQEPADTVFCCLDLSSVDGCVATQVGREFTIDSGGKEYYK